MQTPSTKTLIFVGILIGFTASIALAVSFSPGDAGKVSDGVTFESPDGMEVTIHGETNVTMEDVFPASDTVELNTSAGGNITIKASSDASAAVHTSNMTGTWTNVTGVTAGSTWVEIYPSDKQRVDTRGDVNQLSVRSMALDDGTNDLWYEGTNGGTVTVKLYDLPANTQIVAMDPDTTTYLDSGTTDSNGQVTLDLPASSHAVQLKTKSSETGPTQNNPDPTGQVSSSPDELSIDVQDGDFPQDEVTIEFYLEGSKIDTQTTQSNGTITTTVTQNFDLGEDVDWAVNVSDGYGNVNNQSYQFLMPANITLRNESNASQIITDKNITATFYSANGEIIVERSDSNENGNISLDGLPDTEFVVTFSGSGWYDRRSYIESIGDQQNIYLLNSTAYPTADDEAIETTFVYEDRTGNYPQDETTLRIERAVDPDNDGNFTWQTVAGDYWGAAGEFPFTGEYQERYRLVIKNQETGDRRELGTHIPTDDGVKNIIVGNIIFDAENATGTYWNAGINKSADTLDVVYSDPTNTTTDLTIRIYEMGNESNEIFNQTYSGALGTKKIQHQLTQQQNSTSWVVEFDGQASDGRVYGQVPVGGSTYLLPIDPTILGAFGYILITFIMSLYGPRTATMGAWAGVIAAGGLMFLGWVDIGIATVFVAAMIATGGTLYKESMPS